MKLLARAALSIGILGAVLFASAGRLDLPLYWAYLAVLLAVMAAVLRLADPGLIQERLRPGPGGRDRQLRWVVMPFFLGHVIVAGLDVGRYGWSGGLPLWLRIAALVLLAGCLALAVWALHVNPFFSPVVRIQSERGHRLVKGGPYRLVRHPGYLSSLGSMPCGALVLGSWWALLPLVVPAALLLRRTVLEDAFLLQHLDGYRDYAAEVPRRLLPGVW